MDSAWDRLLDLLDHFAADPGLPLDADAERTFAELFSQAVHDGTADRELHAPEVARWLGGLVAAHRIVRESAPEVPSDDDLATLRVIVTRWLHPARVDH